MTRTSNEFGRLVFPATNYVKRNLEGRNARVNRSLQGNNKNTPWNGNWASSRADPSRIEQPAGMRVPIPYDPGMDSTTTELPLVTKPKARYSKEKKIGLMIEEENKRLMKSQR